MSKLIYVGLIFCSCILSSTAVGAELVASLAIDVDAVGTPVPPTLHGLFFEDINYGADGGLYAELIQNRSFEHGEPLYGWRAIGGNSQRKLEVVHDKPLNGNNPQYLRFERDSAGDVDFGIANTGFDGIALEQGETYRFSFYGRRQDGDEAKIVVQLRDEEGKVVASHEFADLTPEWKKYEAELICPQTVAMGQLAVLVPNAAVVDVDMISLFPARTFQGRRNGLRRDLAQTLADLKPGFMRFPGGCIVEGKDLANAYRWKDTIGDVAERKQNANLWQNRASPEYHQTYGLGFFEFFQFCEDIGCEPLPVLNCGMSCQFRGNVPVPLSELAPWIEDALDLVEFANGPASSTWGAKRAAMGHPESFGMKYLAIGNEQWGEEYFARYDLFIRAINRRYPEIEIISSAGPAPEDDRWRFAWDKFRSGTPAEIVDEHYYVKPNWLYKNTERYASYDRQGPKVFVGEFAAHDEGRRNNLRCALAEAAYMTGLVRHSDVVVMASYAPLLSRYGHSQWQPNLVWFDNRRVVRTPSYHAQAMFAQNRPDVVLPMKVELAQRNAQPQGMIGVGTWNTQADYRDVKVTDPDGKTLFESDFSQDQLAGWKTAGGSWSVADGVLRQTAGGPNVRAVTGDPAWGDYTLTLQAKKLGGSEGFLILFHSPNEESPTWWNIGGWGNTAHAIQGGDFTEHRLPGSVESGRWYDIRIELEGGKIRAYLDDQLVQSEEVEPLPSLYAAAGRDDANGELVIELVNPHAEPCETRIRLKDGKAGGTVRVTTLSDSSPTAENSLEAPDRVAPRRTTLRVSGSDFVHRVPPYAVQVLRVPLGGR